MADSKSVATELYLLARKSGHPVWEGFCTPGDRGAAYRRKLEAQLRTARELLDGFNQGHALRISVDKVLPGWFDVDVSDQVSADASAGGRGMAPFITDDPADYIAWLVDHGVDEATARELVEEAR